MLGRFRNAAQEAEELASYLRPELLAISSSKMKKILSSAAVRPWKLALERILRYKPHTLSGREERILAMQGEVNSASGQTFQQLHNSDMRFGLIPNEKGERVELGHGNLGTFYGVSSKKCSSQSLRLLLRNFFSISAHAGFDSGWSNQGERLQSTRAGLWQRTGSGALSRPSASRPLRESHPNRQRASSSAARLLRFAGKNAKAQKVQAVRSICPALTGRAHEAHLVASGERCFRFDCSARSTLCQTLAGGLRGRWCDRYPNLGKTSGAFSAGSYDGDPYILMNFQENVLNDVFTLAHEAGHSMHSYYSSKHQPFSDYNYRIFVAEVASTFNEQLLSEHLLANCRSKKQRQLLIAREIDNIRGTIYRQVMFAEFERETHAMCEAGEPVLLESLQEIYRRLLIKYLGPQLEIDEYSRLECLRIPHFYRAFYVYKYATGMSAAIALAEKVTQGGRSDLTAYLNFLKSGRSKYPLELLQDAGVDMTVKAPIVAALSRFGNLVQQLDATL